MAHPIHRPLIPQLNIHLHSCAAVLVIFDIKKFQILVTDRIDILEPIHKGAPWRMRSLNNWRDSL